MPWSPENPIVGEFEDLLPERPRRIPRPLAAEPTAADAPLAPAISPLAETVDGPCATLPTDTLASAFTEPVPPLSVPSLSPEGTSFSKPDTSVSSGFSAHSPRRTKHQNDPVRTSQRDHFRDHCSIPRHSPSLSIPTQLIPPERQHAGEAST